MFSFSFKRAVYQKVRRLEASESASTSRWQHARLDNNIKHLLHEEVDWNGFTSYSMNIHILQEVSKQWDSSSKCKASQFQTKQAHCCGGDNGVCWSLRFCKEKGYLYQQCTASAMPIDFQSIVVFHLWQGIHPWYLLSGAIPKPAQLPCLIPPLLLIAEIQNLTVSSSLHEIQIITLFQPGNSLFV